MKTTASLPLCDPRLGIPSRTDRTNQSLVAKLTTAAPGRRPWNAALMAAAVLCLATLLGSVASAATVAATYNSATEVPVTASSYTATGNTVNFTLNYAPATGTELMVVKNTGLGFIGGTFDNLTHGQKVTLSYGGINYHFVANYSGGSGNDLVLLWAKTRPFAWGHNGYGQLGDDTITDRHLPLPVTATGYLAGKTVVALAAGYYHSLALTSEGAVAAWGRNDDGQLGDNTTTECHVPVAVSMGFGSALYGKRVVAIAAGGRHSLALCSDGTIAAWGSNDGGQLGDNTITDRLRPVAVNTESGVSALYGKTVVAIAGGEAHSLALCSDGTVAAWGYNDVFGQLGDNTLIDRRVPVAVNTASGVSALYGKTVVAIAAGTVHSLAVCSDGTVAAWGSNGWGQLGDNTMVNNRNVPVAVNTASGVSALYGKTVVAIAAGGKHSLALCSDGTAAAWGDNGVGQLGDNAGGYGLLSIVPVAVNSAPGVSALYGKTVVAIAGSYYGGRARCSDGTLASWGANWYGELGDDTTTDRLAPVSVVTYALAVGELFIRVSAGMESMHNLALVATPDSEISVTGNSLGIPNGDLSPSLADGTDFGSILMVGGAVTSSYTIHNTGSAPLNLTPQMGISGMHPADFTVTLQPSSPVASGGTSNFQVTFAPTASGIRSAIVSIASDDGGNTPFTFAIQGTGVKVPATVVLGNLSQPYNGAPRSVSVTTVPPGLTVNVTYDGSATAPSAVGSYTVVGTINDVNYYGSATDTLIITPSPEIGVLADGTSLVDAVSTVSFGTVLLGQTGLMRTFTVTNSGNADLTLGTVTLTGSEPGDYVLDGSGLVSPVAPGQSTIFTVAFRPTEDGLRTATLQITSNDANESPFDIALAGTRTRLGSGFDPNPNNAVTGIAVQADGRILLAGGFNSMDGTPRNRIARLNADGTLDLDFNPNANNDVDCLAVQRDGKILLGGNFSNVAGTARNRLARLASDGSLDTGFNPNVNNAVNSVALQTDGKILLVGEFHMVYGTTRNHIARLNADGTLDAGFDPNANGNVHCVAVQANGGILVGGEFNKLGGTDGTLRNRIARIYADGTLDANFNPNANNWVDSVAVEADGSILVGGTFTTIDGTPHNRIARLNTDGTLVPQFNPNANNRVHSVVVQADGKILLGGRFTTVGGTARNCIARVNTDGTLDTSFNPDVDDWVYGVVVQADGQILLGGEFTLVAGVARNSIARLANEPATQALGAPDATQVQWLRGGTAPEVEQVTCELSIDSGETWTPLGSGTRITGGWALNGLSLPPSGLLRARGRSTGGIYNGSSTLIEQVLNYTLLPELRITRFARNSNGTFTIEWIGDGTLQVSETLAAWQDVVGATSPYTFTSTVPKLFARIRR